MSSYSTLVSSTIAAIIALGASHPSLATTSDEQEKCYGIVKAGSNDCRTATASCAGSSTKDNQSDAFILLPKGTCEKVVGGSTKGGDKNGL